MNQVQCIGRLVRDNDLVTLSKDNQVLNNAIAIPRRNAKENEIQAEFIPIVAWNGTASLISKYLVKGDEIGIVGQLKSRSYENKEGQKVNVVEILVHEVTFLRKKQSAANPLAFSVLAANDSAIDILN